MNYILVVSLYNGVGCVRVFDSEVCLVYSEITAASLNNIFAYYLTPFFDYYYYYYYLSYRRPN